MKIVQVLFDQPGQSFNDTSGQNSVITKTGSFKPAPPLTSRTQNSILLDSSNSITLFQIPIGKRSHEQESFSISMYIKLGNSFADQTSILYDSTNGLGIKVEDSNLIFSATDSADVITSIKYKLPDISKAIHIVASYSKGTMSLIVDGIAQSQVQLPSSFKFKSTSTLSLTSSVASSFILIDKLEVFNESLQQPYIASERSLDEVYQNPGQIMSLDDASYFSLSRNLKPITTGFAYGNNKFFSTAESVNLSETSESYIKINDGYNSGYFTDSVFIPTVEDTSHNQIDWYGDSGGIQVSYNTDGSSTYIPLTNHSNIPGFTGGMLYYKVELLRYSSALESPAFTGMSFVVYDSKSFYSDNTLYALATDFNYSVGGDSSSLINQSYANGIKTMSGGFSINTDEARSVEFMFMPTDLGQTCLLDCGGSRYSWSAAGNITKTAIDSIYVNGVNLYSQTSIANVFIPGIWHHVVITLGSNELNPVFINQSKTGTLLGPDNMFSHLGIYDYDMSAKAIKHYKQLTNRVSEPTISDTIIIGADDYSGYNVDRVVLSTQ